MSTRAMASRYSQSSRGSSIDPNQVPLLSRLFGTDAITGGPSVNPQSGEVNYAPYQGSSGFTGGWSRRQASDKNDALIQMMLQQQLANKGVKEGEQVRGEENRKTQRQSDADSIVKAHGIIPNDKNIADYDAATQKILIDSAKALATASQGRAKSSSDFYNSTRGDDAVKYGLEGTELAPAIASQKNSVINAGPGDTVRFNDFTNLMGKPKVGYGSSLNTSEYEPQFAGMDATGKPIFKSMVKRQTTSSPGRFPVAKLSLDGDGVDRGGGVSVVPQPTGVTTPSTPSTAPQPLPPNDPFGIGNPMMQSVNPTRMSSAPTTPAVNPMPTPQSQQPQQPGGYGSNSPMMNAFIEELKKRWAAGNLFGPQQ